mmetsp:Transcript_12637/g.35979  ORF Transcript_12637/g.35979 Transcript_12637/m.35979 type:complete len:108 (+) Transcript_12637:109-432(+)
MADECDESNELPGPNVTTTLYLRASKDAEYELHLRQEGVSIADMNTTIDWWFPAGDSTLDRVTIDDMDYASSGDTGWPKGSDTVVKEGSEVHAYKTMLDDEEDSEED